MERTLATLAGALLVACSTLASAQATGTSDAAAAQLDATAANRGQTQVAAQIASNFGTLAGSSDNALALVNALRNGTQATLTTPPATPDGTATTTSFTPPTGKMGWGNVFHSLALAKAALAQVGITNPTSAQLQAALMGGSVTRADGTTATLKGILQMRADGMGWGQIAQASGTKLGPVVSGIKSNQVKVAKLPKTNTTTVSTAANSSPKTTSAVGATAVAGAPAKGVTTASGVANAQGGGRGLVTASGASTGGSVTTPANSHGQGNAYGRGIVTATGSASGAATVSPATGHGNSAQGAGVVNAAGGNASVASNAGGNGGDHGKGKGKGGG
jgi:hypothetical protein